MSLIRPSQRLLMAAASSARPAKPVIAIIGATGTGKSQLAVDLAERFNGEVINADAMQMYRGLPVITNKITPDERKSIPHHLLGCVSLEEPTWRVDKFVNEATRLIAAIHDRGKLPILVGGTLYYLQSLLFPQRLAVEESRPKTPAGQSIHPDLDLPTEQLYERLKEVDPTIAARWHPTDHRKIRRSLELWYQTGKRASEIYREQNLEKQALSLSGSGGMSYDTLFFWTDADRETLKTRLDYRVDEMLKNGLLKEVRELHNHLDLQRSKRLQVDLTRGIWVSIGFKEFLPYVEAAKSETHEDEVDHVTVLRDAVEATKAATRQYAKSQIKWVRIKLLVALQESKAADRLFLLDTTDASRTSWEQVILKQAVCISHDFLQGQPLPAPKTLSTLAAEMLNPKQDYDLSQRPDLWRQQTCDVCNVTAPTQKSWQHHIESNRHKKALQSRIRRSQLEARRAQEGTRAAETQR